jgi:septum site-determining protein MinD
MAKILTIASGKGGVGKSTICVGLGIALASAGRKVLLVEMDHGLRGLDLMLGIGEELVYDLSDILSGRCDPLQAMLTCPYQDHLALLCASMDPGYLVDRQTFSEFLHALSKFFDVILIDGPAGIHEELIDAVSPADTILLVTNPDPVSVRDSENVSRLLWSKGFQSQKLLINKVYLDETSAKTGLTDFDALLDIVGIPLLGVIPFDPALGADLMAGKGLSKERLTSYVFSAIGRRIFGEDVPLTLDIVAKH